MRYSFLFDIEPIQQQRPRARRMPKGVMLYDPKKVKQFKIAVGNMARVQMKQNEWERLEDRPLMLDVTFYRPIQQSISKVEHDRRARHEVLPIVKPDNSNYLKSLEDALNGIVWKDDALITDIRARKRYAEQPRIEIEVEEI